MLENARFASRVEHLNTVNLKMTFTMTVISYSYIIRLVRYLGDEIWIGHKKLLINYLKILVNVPLSAIAGVHFS